MNSVDIELQQRYKSLEFGKLSDEETVNRIRFYTGQGDITEDQANEMIASMYVLKEGDTAPDSTLYNVDGEALSLHSLLSADKPTVINFGSYT